MHKYLVALFDHLEVGMLFYDLSNHFPRASGR